MIGLLAATATTPQVTDPTTYVIVGGAGIFIVYVMMRMTKRKQKDPFDKPFQARSLSQTRSVERGFENLLVELTEMSRQMTAQLDTRSAKLEALITDADERIARLNVLIQQAPARPTAFAMPPEPAAPPTPAAPVVAEALKVEDVAPTPIDPRHAEVYRLADEGKSSREIAAELGQPSGEIELILALRPRS